MGDDTTIQARPRMTSAAPGAPLGDLGDLGGRDKKTTASSPRASAASTGVGGHRFATRTHGGDGGGSPRGMSYAGTPLGTPFGTPPGTALERKKSYHPELLAGADCPASASERRELFVLPRDALRDAGVDLSHGMELIHLNRTCTSVDLALASPKAASTVAAHDVVLGLGLRGTSDANLTDEEKVHRVRHQVSFAQDMGHAGPGRPAFHGDDLINALRNRMRTAQQEAPEEEDSDQDEQTDEDVDVDERGNSPGNVDVGTMVDEDQGGASYAFLENAASISPDSDVDYLAVRPSLASTQLNELRGPN